MITLASLMCMAVTPSFINGSQQKPESVSELTKTEKIGTTDTVMTDIVKKEESSEKVSDKELFERTVSIIKDYESLHKASHWPYVGYGHLVRKGDGFKKGVELSKKQADRLLRKDLQVYVDMYKKYGRDAYLLAALAYNCGHGRVSKSQVLAKIKSGDREGIRDAYLKHTKSGGRFRQQLYDRRLEELEQLFIP